MKIIFFGTTKFSANILQDLVKNGIKIEAVVTKNERSEVKKISSSLPTYFPENIKSEDFYNTLKKYDPDIFLVAAYGKIFPKKLLSLPKIACINVHASLLPEYRGADPIRRCLMNLDKKTGITIMDMVEKLDAGDMLLQEEVKISSDMNKDMLEKILLDLAKKMVQKILKLLKQGKVVRKKQEESMATYAPKMKKEEMFIEWDDSKKEEGRVRALSFKPGAGCKILVDQKEKLLKIVKAKSVQKDIGKKEIVFENDHVYIGCSHGALEIIEVQLEGKKRMDVRSFLRGIKGEIKIL